MFNKKIKQKHKSYCLGDFKHPCKILKVINKQTNNLRSDSVRNIENIVLTTKCRMETSKGVVWSVGVATLEDTTHNFAIKYSHKIKSKYFIEVRNELYKIIRVENVDELNELLVLKCTKKGDMNIRSNRT